MSPAPVAGSSQTYSALPQAGKTHYNVQQSEQSSASDTRPPPTHGRGLWDKLGWYNIGVLVFGTIATLLAVAFLGLLWAGSRDAMQGGAAPPVWYHIVERAWTARVVTICTVAIRLAITAQMGVFSALVAALVLENIGVPTSRLPLLSVIRSVNTGPQTHWTNILSIHTPSQFFYVAAVVLAVLNSFALQFTSTLLLSDFGPTPVVFDSNSSSIAYGIPVNSSLSGTDFFTSGMDYIKNAPSTYARFAEYTESPYEAINYVDTGKALRAYLPFNSLDQRSLRSYNGPASVVDSRVMCVAPSLIITRISLNSDVLTVAGNLTWEGSYPALRSTNSSDASEESDVTPQFVCAATMSSEDDVSSYWEMSVCFSYFLDSIQFSENIQDGGPMQSPFQFLVLNTTGAMSSWDTAYYDDSVLEEDRGQLEWNQTSSGPWTKFTTSNSSLGLGLDASLCFADFTTTEYDVVIHSDQDYTEPELQWNSASQSYSTDDIQRVLGATSESSLSLRGIPSLRPAIDWSYSSMKNATQSSIWSSIYTVIKSNFIFLNLGSEFTEGEPTLVMSSKSTGQSVHRSHAAIFQDIMKNTNNPALALQAFLTVITQMAYYDFFPQFEVTGRSTHTASSTVVVPMQWVGFIVIMVLLAIHFILILAATILFLTKTKHSLLGNAWQAFAQIASKDVDHTIQYAANTTDNEVQQFLKKNGHDKTEFVLKTGLDDGRSQAVNRRRTGSTHELQLLNRNGEPIDKI
ncbi:hypothetical protein P153DRAFT_381879 [Dothidotthia symphoricarpi CBS 119687]|uniref:Uncharacterized protein n=1 Tax=Dothidotthia symphoricarpi CBS 119687 TaxID=1392245 RepID=A0A6A6ANS6_9PLEO|nr:uncharacterized protein P153DRAFT_381879 [Dothidotthia symphoricarpi CBS 119687]KAF2133450.1 hypothetical protein P153DRAFT_381879 [Dothidotthia symphoricarpi CBS 119687]